ncbi:MAG: hypothetical protein KME52_27900 [Desmonostoc geniculatum HA4340-LM1]|jgi:hypothetical protein|nr:hypothetical protein [Desmonostoc geniculatum HA4340-LM1]
MTNSDLIALGIGQDGEPVLLEKVNESCYFVHCAGNEQSPFEFSEDVDPRKNEANARAFASFLGKLRVEKNMEDAINE